MNNDYDQQQLIQIDEYYKNIEIVDSNISQLPIQTFITDQHIDIIVRYLYIKAYVENKRYEKYKKLYEKMQKKRVNKSYYREFNALIDSFQNNGFLKNFPVLINMQNKLLNGSHRLACCLYFNINPYVYKLNQPDHDYTITWFQNNGFTSDEIEEIFRAKKELEKKYMSHNEKKLEKCYAAMISPIVNNKLDCEYFIKHAYRLRDNGIKGLFLCGNTGKGMDLPISLKKVIINTALINLNEDFSLIVHVGANKISEVFEIIDITNQSEVDAIASMVPYHNITKFTDIKHYYETIANRSTKPVIIYHLPKITKIDLSASELIELLNINNVIGIKFTDNNLEKLKEISSQVHDKNIFYGMDDLLLSGLTNGATAGIGGCYNLFPSFVCGIIQQDNKSSLYQSMLNYCIKELRKKYPELLGGEFVLKCLELKGNLSDYEFYKWLGGNE